MFHKSSASPNEVTKDKTTFTHTSLPSLSCRRLFPVCLLCALLLLTPADLRLTCTNLNHREIAVTDVRPGNLFVARRLHTVSSHRESAPIRGGDMSRFHRPKCSKGKGINWCSFVSISMAACILMASVYPGMESDKLHGAIMRTF